MICSLKKAAVRWFVLMLGIGVFLAASLAAEPEAALRAGIVRIDITPKMPVTMAGYESRRELSQGVHDALSARIVAFTQNGRKLVLVSTDILGYYGGTAESMRTAILDVCHLQPAELFLTAIHTHSGPNLVLTPEKGHSNNVAYTRALEAQLIAAIRQALSETVPVEIGTGSGASSVGCNRRQLTYDDSGNPKISLGRNPAAQIDREVQVVKIAQTEGNALTAILFAYATHSTSMGPKNYMISGDVHGLAEQFLEQYHGSPVIAPAFAGASGDIDPWFRVLPEFKTEQGWVPESVLMGTLLGEEVEQVVSRIQKLEANAPLHTAFKTLALPGKPRGETRATGKVTSSSFNLTVGRLGGVAFVGLGGEVFNDIGLAIKNSSPFVPTIIITHCNGTAGYLPVARAYLEGGYEVQSSQFAPGADEIVVKEALSMLHEL